MGDYTLRSPVRFHGFLPCSDQDKTRSKLSLRNFKLKVSVRRES